MKIRNAIIITSDDTEISMNINEMPDFSRNVVFSRDRLPADFMRALHKAIAIPDLDPATESHQQPSMGQDGVA